jgi:putative endonuclease
MSHYVYILVSQKNGRYYIGSSDNPHQRLIDHNSGRSAYTKRNRPFKLEFIQKFDTVSEARKIETKIKKWKRRDFIEKVIKDGYIRSA